MVASRFVRCLAVAVTAWTTAGVAAQPTSEWDERKGNPAGFLDRAYLSLTRERR